MPLKIAIVGAGPAGCFAACHLNKEFEITLFDKFSPLKTLLPTGGGKCNLAHAEYEFKELAKSYPRGEKFLYSVFSRFATAETIDFFEKIGIRTYTRDDGRIFPISNRSHDVRNKILSQLHHCYFKKEEVINIKKIKEGFEVQTTNAKYYFDKIIVAIGGKNNYNLIKNLGHSVIEPKPSLVALKTIPCYKNLQGVTVKNCKLSVDKQHFYGDVLFTDEGLTGPVIYEISSIFARKVMPYNLNIDFINKDINLQELFNLNPHKDLGNLIAKMLPKSAAKELFVNVNLEQKCKDVSSNTKELVNSKIRSHNFKITGTKKDGETVICGGVNTNEINSKTFESKITKNLYICGEVLNVDGFCGGYNLQFCWSSGFLAAEAINSNL